MGSRTVLQGLASIKWKNMENTLAPGRSWDGKARRLEVREGALPHNPRYPQNSIDILRIPKIPQTSLSHPRPKSPLKKNIKHHHKSPMPLHFPRFWEALLYKMGNQLVSYHKAPILQRLLVVEAQIPILQRQYNINL